MFGLTDTDHMLNGVRDHIVGQIMLIVLPLTTRSDANNHAVPVTGMGCAILLERRGDACRGMIDNRNPERIVSLVQCSLTRCVVSVIPPRGRIHALVDREQQLVNLRRITVDKIMPRPHTKVGEIEPKVRSILSCHVCLTQAIGPSSGGSEAAAS